jgi:hypothetical protein
MEAHTHAYVEHHKTGHHLLDVVVSVCALITSTVSILLAYHTGHNMERLVHANSWPALQLRSSNSGADGRVLGFNITNAGIGPARIHTMEFLVDGVAIEWRQDVAPLLEACCAEPFRRARDATGKRWDDNLYTYPIAGSFLSPRESVPAFGWRRGDAEAEVWEALDRARIDRRVTMRVCYCSVFDECWLVETVKFPPGPVSSCPSIHSPPGGH